MTEYQTGQSLDGPCDKSDDPIIGSVIDEKYRVVGKLGRGGMGAVYKAEHVSMARTAAVKILGEHLTQSVDSINRFKLEAASLSKLSHPHIIKVFNFGITESHGPYIALEYIEGVSLSEILLQYHRLPMQAFRAVFEPFLDALAYLHEQGICHRDLKPSNLMVIPTAPDMVPDLNGRFEIKIIDFGLAKRLNDETSAQKLTKTGTLLGTPQYMSPEQCAGQAATESADLYAVGCMMYECLASKPPFGGETFLEIAMGQMTQPAPPLVGVSKHLSAVVHKALAKTPAQRFSTADEFKQAMQAAIARPDDLPQSLLQSTFQPNEHIWIQRTRPKPKSAYLAAALGACGVIAGLAYFCFLCTKSTEYDQHTQQTMTLDSSSPLDRLTAIKTENRQAKLADATSIMQKFYDEHATYQSKPAPKLTKATYQAISKWFEDNGCPKEAIKLSIYQLLLEHRFKFIESSICTRQEAEDIASRWDALEPSIQKLVADKADRHWLIAYAGYQDRLAELGSVFFDRTKNLHLAINYYDKALDFRNKYLDKKATPDQYYLLVRRGRCYQALALVDPQHINQHNLYLSILDFRRSRKYLGMLDRDAMQLPGSTAFAESLLYMNNPDMADVNNVIRDVTDIHRGQICENNEVNQASDFYFDRAIAEVLFKKGNVERGKQFLNQAFKSDFLANHPEERPKLAWLERLYLHPIK